MYLKCILMCDGIVWIQLDQNMVSVTRCEAYCNSNYWSHKRGESIWPACQDGCCSSLLSISFSLL